MMNTTVSKDSYEGPVFGINVAASDEQSLETHRKRPQRRHKLRSVIRGAYSCES